MEKYNSANFLKWYKEKAIASILDDSGIIEDGRRHFASGLFIYEISEYDTKSGLPECYDFRIGW